MPKNYANPEWDPAVSDFTNNNSLSTPMRGTIVDCQLINVREKPSYTAAVLCILNVGNQVELIPPIDPASDFYHAVTSSGIDGYICKKYVALDTV